MGAMPYTPLGRESQSGSSFPVPPEMGLCRTALLLYLLGLQASETLSITEATLTECIQ